MRRHLYRLALAFILSICGLVATQVYFGDDGNSRRNTNEAPIAKLMESVNEVQRKPLGRLVWEGVTQGEDLFAGEDIRTSSASSAKIMLVQTKTLIELDPDSLIRLEKSQNGLALNFLEGNLLVKSSGSGVTVKSGDSAIALNKTDLSLSKSSTGKVDLEVLKGKAEIQKGDKAIALDENSSGQLSTDGLDQDQSRLRILSPLPGEPILIDVAKQENVSFTWAALPPSYSVTIERGTTRGNLVRSESAQAKGESGELKVRSKVGKYYFRLVANSTDPKLPTLTSKVLPLEISPKAPPTPLSPAANEVIVLNQEIPNLHFKWANRMRFESLIIEIAKDAGLRNIIAKETLSAERTQFETPWKEEGGFFWRITGFVTHQEKKLALSSPIMPFTTKLSVQLVPPVVKSPFEGQHYTFQQVAGPGLFLSWDPVPGVSKYHVQLTREGQEVLNRSIQANPFRATDLSPGHYELQMASYSSSNERSVPSEVRHFVIEELPRIEWANGDEPQDFQYFSERPSFEVAWQNNVPLVTKWNVLYRPEGQTDTQPTRASVTKPGFRSTVPNDGSYEVELEGMNAAGQVLARSNPKVIRVSALPLLPPPEFTADLPSTLKADRRGFTQLSWAEVRGAKRYQVWIRSQDGETLIDTPQVDRTVASLRKMKPGKYRVTLSAVDEHERNGTEGSPRTLEVPEHSDILPPKVKKFKVK